MTSRVAFCGALALAASFSVSPARAAEGFEGCAGTISSLPATVSTPGVWCLRQGLATSIGSGAAITVNASNVTIDCNHNVLSGTGAGPATEASGIYAYQRANVTVRRCNIQGFEDGIEMFGTAASGHLVEDNLLVGNTVRGIHVQGDGGTVRGNRVLDTGNAAVAKHAYGISTAYAVDVLENTIDGVIARVGGNGFATGINTDVSVGASLRGNRVRGLMRDGTGSNRAIYNSQSSRLIIEGNHLQTAPSPGSRGISCTDADSRARNNIVLGFTYGVLGCVNQQNSIGD